MGKVGTGSTICCYFHSIVALNPIYCLVSFTVKCQPLRAYLESAPLLISIQKVTLTHLFLNFHLSFHQGEEVPIHSIYFLP